MDGDNWRNAYPSKKKLNLVLLKKKKPHRANSIRGGYRKNPKITLQTEGEKMQGRR